MSVYVYVWMVSRPCLNSLDVLQCYSLTRYTVTIIPATITPCLFSCLVYVCQKTKFEGSCSVFFSSQMSFL